MKVAPTVAHAVWLPAPYGAAFSLPGLTAKRFRSLGAARRHYLME